MGMDKAFGQHAGNQRVLFKLVDTSGTPSIGSVSPSGASGSISVADTAQGRATVTIKNFKGKTGSVNIQLTSCTTSVMSAVANSTIAYSGDDLTFEISSEDDSSTLTDTSVFVAVEAF